MEAALPGMTRQQIVGLRRRVWLQHVQATWPSTLGTVPGEEELYMIQMFDEETLTGVPPSQLPDNPHLRRTQVGTAARRRGLRARPPPRLAHAVRRRRSAPRRRRTRVPSEVRHRERSRGRNVGSTA